MGIPVTEVGGAGPRIDEGQYDLTLSLIEDVPDGKFGAQLKLDWLIEGSEDDEGNPLHFFEWVSKKWGTVAFPTNWRLRVYTMTGGKVNKFVDAIIADTPAAIDTDWFLGSPVLAEIRHATNPETGKTKAKITSCMSDRRNADKLKSDFIGNIKAFDAALYNRCAAVAGLPLAGSPVNAGTKAAAVAVAEPEDDEDDVPF